MESNALCSGIAGSTSSSGAARRSRCARRAVRSRDPAIAAFRAASRSAVTTPARLPATTPREAPWCRPIGPRRRRPRRRPWPERRSIRRLPRPPPSRPGPRPRPPPRPPPPRAAGAGQHGLARERRSERRIQRDRLDTDIGVAEAQAVEPAQGGGELVLATSGALRLDHLQLPGVLGNLTLGEPFPAGVGE